MDKITSRSLYASVVIHGVVVVVSLFGLFPPSTPTSPAVIAIPVPAVAEKPAEKSAEQPREKPPVLAPLILAEDSFLPASAPPSLPPLPAPKQLTSVTPLIPLPMTPVGRELSRGTSGDRNAPLALPPSDGPATPTLNAVRTRMSSPPATDWAEDARRTTATSLQIFIERAFWTKWRSHATQVTNRTLVLWLRSGSGNHVVEGGLFQCTTGVPDLDRAIEAWLVSGELGLPAIDTASIYYIRIKLP